MEPSAKTPNVFIYSDPSRGMAHGYTFDGWAPDGEVFLYTGEGPVGDQLMRDGNKALLDHKKDGKAVRLFVADGRAIFRATEPLAGAEPWVSDGTLSGTQVLSNLEPNAGSSSPADFTTVNTLTFFSATRPLYSGLGERTFANGSFDSFRHKKSG